MMTPLPALLQKNRNASVKPIELWQTP